MYAASDAHRNQSNQVRTKHYKGELGLFLTTLNADVWSELLVSLGVQLARLIGPCLQVGECVCESNWGILLEYPTTVDFQCCLLKNDPYTYYGCKKVEYSKRYPNGY